MSAECTGCGAPINVYANGWTVIAHKLPCHVWETARLENRTMEEAAAERQNAIDFPRGEVGHDGT